jgi:hypothetical protein
MRTTTAAIVGFVAASLVPALVFSLLSPIAGRFDWEIALRGFPIFFFFSLLLTAVLGVPAFLVLLALKLVRWWSALAAGLVIGGLIALLLGFPNAPQLNTLVGMGGTGAAGALAFWVVWTQRSDAQ